MRRQPPHRAVNRLPRLMCQQGIGWGDLARRALLSPRTIALLRDPRANPSLATAQRVADVLGVTVEALWTLSTPRRRR